MVMYSRNVSKKLFGLRLVFVLLSISCFLAFIFQQNNLGYFIAVVWLTLSTIAIKDIVIKADSLLITKYYIFSLVKFSWEFNKADKVKLYSLEASFGEDGGPIFQYDDGSGLGCLLMIVEVFLPSKIVKQQFTIEDINSPRKRVQILLSKLEFDSIKNWLSQK
jgi:hypothetical protein